MARDQEGTERPLARFQPSPVDSPPYISDLREVAYRDSEGVRWVLSVVSTRSLLLEVQGPIGSAEELRERAADFLAAVLDPETDIHQLAAAVAAKYDSHNFTVATMHGTFSPSQTLVDLRTRPDWTLSWSWAPFVLVQPRPDNNMTHLSVARQLAHVSIMTPSEGRVNATEVDLRAAAREAFRAAGHQEPQFEDSFFFDGEDCLKQHRELNAWHARHPELTRYS